MEQDTQLLLESNQWTSVGYIHDQWFLQQAGQVWRTMLYLESREQVNSTHANYKNNANQIMQLKFISNWIIGLI